MKQHGIPFYLHCALIKELSIKLLEKESINEGIDLTYAHDGIKVSYNDKHRRGIDASTKNNPTTIDICVPAIHIQDGVIPVYSILQRTPMKVKAGSSDGNPLVYAFKNEKGYSFKSDYDKETIQVCIDSILKKFIANYFAEIDGKIATIVCPSENSLNKTFANSFKKNAESVGKTINIQDEYLVKYPVDDVRAEIVDNANSDLNQWLMSLPDSVAMKKRAMLDKALDRMTVDHNGVFAYHFIKDIDIRKHISNTMKLSSYAKNIDGENVIVIDDTMTQGKTLTEACQLLCGSYLPKSIIGLTLFSPLK